MIEIATNQSKVPSNSNFTEDKVLRTLTIDPELHDLIPPLTSEEREMLEASILKEGCETPLTIWNGVIVDGHNRYEICHAHGIPFAVSEKEFASREEALLWIIRNQLGRRNLTSYQRGELIHRYKPLVAAQSEQGKRTDLSNFFPNSGRSSDPIGTDKKLAQMAGMSHDTLYKVGKLSKAADEKTKQKLRLGEVSINGAYTDLMHKQHANETKVCGRCGQEKPVTDFTIPSNRQGFSALCRSCKKEVSEAAKQAAISARQTERPEQEQLSATQRLEQPNTTQPNTTQPLSSVAMYKGHPIHVGAPFPDRPEMFAYLEDHVRLITDNFVAGAANAMRMYTPGMASPENTRTLREILKSACTAVLAFDEYMKEMQEHE